MPVVNIEIRSKAYPIACGEGQEQRLQELAVKLDKRLHVLSEQMGKGSDAVLLLMAALMMEDELQDAREKVEKLQKIESSQPSVEQLRKEIEQKFGQTANATLAQSINGVADYIENIAKKLEKA